MKRKTRIRTSFVALLLFIGAGSLRSQETDYKAYTLFIYNFMKYVEWPENNSKGDFVICVVGESPIMKELQVLASTKKLKGRTIILKRCDSPEESSAAHLVFVPSSKSSLIKNIKEQTKGKPLLIVGEREGLARKGAGISFVTLDEDALKFDINKKEIETRQLKVSNSLINLGMVIN